MQILLGTTNPSKRWEFEALLSGFGLTFVTLRDLDIHDAPGETGRDPKENAMIKAAYYAKYADAVIASDSALYVCAWPLHDPRQPGLFVRRAPDGHERTDEEMIADYARMAHDQGGRMRCCYMTALAVSRGGETKGFFDESEMNGGYTFDMVETPHPLRHVGWPLDSLSIDLRTGKYFVDPASEAPPETEEERAQKAAFEARRRAFLIEALKL